VTALAAESFACFPDRPNLNVAFQKAENWTKPLFFLSFSFCCCCVVAVTCVTSCTIMPFGSGGSGRSTELPPEDEPDPCAVLGRGKRLSRRSVGTLPPDAVFPCPVFGRSEIGGDGERRSWLSPDLGHSTDAVCPCWPRPVFGRGAGLNRPSVAAESLRSAPGVGGNDERAVHAVRGRVGDGRTSTSVGFARRKADARSGVRVLTTARCSTRRISTWLARRLPSPRAASTAEFGGGVCVADRGGCAGCASGETGSGDTARADRAERLRSQSSTAPAAATTTDGRRESGSARGVLGGLSSRREHDLRSSFSVAGSSGGTIGWLKSDGEARSVCCDVWSDTRTLLGHDVLGAYNWGRA